MLTARKDSLTVRFSAVAFALLTVAAFIYGSINFQQRSSYVTPDDGVTWVDQPDGVSAWHVTSGSSAERAGIKAGDLIRSINGKSISRATQVTQRIWSFGPYSEVKYDLTRSGRGFEAQVILEKAERPYTIENYLRVVGMLYLFIGVFIFVRRWNAPRAMHFYAFCLASFVLYSFHYSGKLNEFDWQIYWGNVVALLLQPALLVHFALVFPDRRTASMPLRVIGTYTLPLLLLLLHVGVATQTINLPPTLPALWFLDQLELGYLGAYFLMASFIFLRSYRRAPSGILRQQLKWVTGGTMAAIVPFLLLYVVPFFMGLQTRPWMKLSVLSLALIPLSFGYAIIRYRLMDVDIIFKRGVAYTIATAGVVAAFFAFVYLAGQLLHVAWPTWQASGIIGAVIAAFLFQPLRDWIQARLDRFFYRDRFDYRRTLIEFGRTITNEVRLEPLLGSVLDRISQTLLVDRIAVFLEEPEQLGRFHLARSMGVRYDAPLDLSFLSPANPALSGGYFFYEPRASALREDLSDSARGTLEQLDLNYFIACRVHDRIVGFLGLGKTVDGDLLSSEDVELLLTMADYVAIAIDNARLYHSLEQKAAQVERLKDFSENIVESMNVGVLAVDLAGKIESWNTQLEQMIGVGRTDAIGRALNEVLPADLVAEIAARAADEHVSGIYKFRLHNSQGRPIVVNVSIAPLIGKGGERLGRLVLIDDTTQRTRLEEQLMQTDKLHSLGLLAAGVAHEVNTPLAVISNYSQMLAKQLSDEDPRSKLVDKIVKQTFRASQIVNNLLNFSRTGASEFAEVNINSVIEDTLPLVAHPFKTARISLIKALAQDLPPILGSPNRLAQVFLNLFLNARDAMPNGGMIEIRTVANNGHVEIEISDTGQGISRDHLNRIFDPFFTTKSTGRGTGLGLSVTYGIVKEHAGKIDVRSTPGKGTAFHLEFPTARKAVHV